ncbi:uncharacterized protein MELLADRAFT_86527 [Melampsora larici-populina 98AG31]|uniref:Uncharacterized protein n=1 Tax=Melampsora larici-populina (strain 98AG31 / pathotype 3-4-7) TaxID=747676 RepID=F4RM47_MELLP|nr:uncharacterized protein MELLADRAFT_86527 [Melampsora larici-populina 98AG31]EGG06361.1 hypothetical protein MELLADRAFT_86527 [Melampsora larici-populina 98AG31]
MNKKNDILEKKKFGIQYTYSLSDQKKKYRNRPKHIAIHDHQIKLTKTKVNLD